MAEKGASDSFGASEGSEPVLGASARGETSHEVAPRSALHLALPLPTVLERVG